MNNKIFIITVFISNIAFGAVIALPKTLNTITAQTSNQIARKSVKRLSERGLDDGVATQKVHASLENDMQTNEIMVQNILTSVTALHENDIISFIANASLHNNKVDLSSYETLISLVQHKSHTLLNSSLRLELEKVSDANERVKKMRTFV